MVFEPDPPGPGWLALRTHRDAWSPDQLQLIREAVREHQGLPGPVRSCVAGWLAQRPVSWQAAFEALPASPALDPVSRFAWGRILLHFAPRARHGHESTVAAMDRFLAAVPYRLPGSRWLRVEQDLYLERRLGRGAARQRLALDAAQDALQTLSLRLLDHALDTYKPGPAGDPDRWVSEILKNIKIDGQRKSNTEARYLDPISPEEVPEELHEHHGSAEDETISQELHALISHISGGPAPDEATREGSRALAQQLGRALASLSNHQLAVLYLSLFPPPDRDAGIATLMGTSLANIRKRRHDALKALRHALESCAKPH